MELCPCVSKVNGFGIVVPVFSLISDLGLGPGVFGFLVLELWPPGFKVFFESEFQKGESFIGLKAWCFILLLPFLLSRVVQFL